MQMSVGLQPTGRLQGWTSLTSLNTGELININALCMLDAGVFVIIGISKIPSQHVHSQTKAPSSAIHFSRSVPRLIHSC